MDQEEFNKRREAALKKGEQLKQQLDEDYKKEVEYYTKKGYTKGEARMQVSKENIAAMEYNGHGKRGGR